MRQHCYKHSHSDGDACVFQILKKVIYGSNSTFSEGNASAEDASFPDEWLPEDTFITPLPDDPTPGEYYPYVPSPDVTYPGDLWPDGSDPDDPESGGDGDDDDNNNNGGDNGDNGDDSGNQGGSGGGSDSDEPDTPDTPIPPVNNNIYVGAISMPTTMITSFKDITENDAKQLTVLSDGVYTKYQIDASQYTLVTVIVPEHRKVFMDDGFGNKIQFYTNATDGYGEPFYSNGEISLTIDETVHKVYGIFTLAAGTIYIYVE